MNTSFRCAYRCTNPEVGRLLLTLGSSTGIQDSVHHNTALHWACLAKNYGVISLLVVKAKANCRVINGRKETALDIIDQHMDQQKKDKKVTFMLPKRVTDLMLKDMNSSKRSLTLVQRVRENENAKLWGTCSMPLVVIGALGFIFNSALTTWYKAGLLLIVYVYLNAAGTLFFDHRLTRIMPLSVGVATKVWFYYAWLVHIHPFVGSVSTLTFLAGTSGLWYNLIKTWRGDPGIISASREDKYRTIIEFAERDGFDPKHFCSTCLIRRPLRSKVSLKFLLVSASLILIDLNTRIVTTCGSLCFQQPSLYPFW